MLTKGQVPGIRCLQQTAASLQILAALYQLLAKVTGQRVDTDQRLSSFTFFGLCPSWEVMSPSVHSVTSFPKSNPKALGKLPSLSSPHFLISKRRVTGLPWWSSG